MKYPLLIPVIGHGATDIIDYPIKSVIYNMISILLVNKLTYKERKAVLVGFSIYHLANDFHCKFKYIVSSIFHIIMIKKPVIAKCYFCFYHTPLHYFRQLFINNKWKYKIFIGLITSITANYAINRDIELYMNNKLGEFWWISPIIVHIFLTSYKHSEIINNYKNTRIFKYIKNKYLI